MTKRAIAIFHSESKTIWYGILCDPNNEDIWEVVETFHNIDDANDWLNIFI